MSAKYDLTHLAMVGTDGIPVFLVPSATPDKELNAKRKAERAFIVLAVNAHAELLAALKGLVILGDRDDVIDTFSDEIHAAEKAINKAEGR